MIFFPLVLKTMKRRVTKNPLLRLLLSLKFDVNDDPTPHSGVVSRIIFICFDTFQA